MTTKLQNLTDATLGLVGFVVAFIGTALLAGASWALFSLLPGATLRAPGFIGIPPSSLFATTFAIAALGWALFGVDMLRVRVYPRAAAVILTIGAVISFVPILFPIPLSNIVLAVGIAWLGYSLFTRERTSSAEPSA